MSKNKIIDTVINMVLRGNVDTISMSKIAKEAEVGKSTIYEYFDSKEELMEMATQKFTDTYVGYVLDCKMEKTTYESFYNHMIVALKIGKDCMRLFETLGQNCISFFATDRIKEIIQEGLDKVINRFEQIFAKAKEEGIIVPKRDMKAQKYIIYGLMKGSFFLNFEGKPVPDEQFIKDVYENILILLNN